jgi:FG-GAP-like repeat
MLNRITSSRACLLLSLLSIVLLLSPAPRAEAAPQLTLSPQWTTGIISKGVGPAGIIVKDLRGDGVKEILACSTAYAYVLSKTATGYDTIWYSPNLDCSKVAAGDRDGDGISEVYVGSKTSQVYVFRGDTFAQVGVLSLPGSGAVNGLGVADVDGDGKQELVVVRADATFVYDASTGTLKWEADGKGGTELGIGNVDGDAQLEIVVNGNPAHILDAKTHTEKWLTVGSLAFRWASPTSMGMVTLRSPISRVMATKIVISMLLTQIRKPSNGTWAPSLA